jgi:radical SAM protein with 4Fe4S-binding SPASM domain
MLTPDARGDRSNVELVSYAEYFLNTASNNYRFPPQAMLGATSRCNLRCVHCYIPADERDKGIELGYRIICRLIDQLANNGTILLCFTGGEIFYRKDFLSIYKYAAKKGFFIILFTNATLINREIINILKKYPPMSVEVTVHSMSPKAFDEVTHVQGSFRKCMRGISLLKEAGIRVGIKTVVMKSNTTEVGKLRKFANSIGATYRFDTLLVPRLDGCNEPCTHRASPRDILKIETQTYTRKKINFKKTIERVKKVQTAWLKNGTYMCGGGERSFLIDYHGMLRICPLAAGFGVDLTEKPIPLALKELKKIAKKNNNINMECLKCKNLLLCGWCPPLAKLETGRNKPVPYLCQLGEKRRRAFFSDSRTS